MNILDVSVVSANYNNGRYLQDFFESFLRSDAQPKELIVVDDGSKDDSLDIMRQYQERMPYLKIVVLEKNQGFGNALNAGIDVATGTYIARIDPDDYVLPTFLSEQYRRITTSGVDVLGCNLSMIRSDTGGSLGLTNVPLAHDEIAERMHRGEHGVFHGATMIRAALFQDNRYIQQNVPAEDYDIFSRFLVAGARYMNNPDALVVYRIHPESISSILPFDTIAKTYRLRDAIFGSHTSRLVIYRYYLYMKFYRIALGAGNPVKRYAFLGLGALLYPSRVLRKIRQVFR